MLLGVVARFQSRGHKDKQTNFSRLNIRRLSNDNRWIGQECAIKVVETTVFDEEQTVVRC